MWEYFRVDLELIFVHLHIRLLRATKAVFFTDACFVSQLGT